LLNTAKLTGNKCCGTASFIYILFGSSFYTCCGAASLYTAPAPASMPFKSKLKAAFFKIIQVIESIVIPITYNKLEFGCKYNTSTIWKIIKLFHTPQCKYIYAQNWQSGERVSSGKGVCHLELQVYLNEEKNIYIFKIASRVLFEISAEYHPR
jgi:hypothetical protein